MERVTVSQFFFSVSLTNEPGETEIMQNKEMPFVEAHVYLAGRFGHIMPPVRKLGYYFV